MLKSYANFSTMLELVVREGMIFEIFAIKNIKIYMHVFY